MDINLDFELAEMRFKLSNGRSSRARPGTKPQLLSNQSRKFAGQAGSEKGSGLHDRQAEMQV
jgi:hypothetical protein